MANAALRLDVAPRRMAKRRVSPSARWLHLSSAENDLKFAIQAMLFALSTYCSAMVMQLLAGYRAKCALLAEILGCSLLSSQANGVGSSLPRCHGSVHLLLGDLLRLELKLVGRVCHDRGVVGAMMVQEGDDTIPDSPPALHFGPSAETPVKHAVGRWRIRFEEALLLEVWPMIL
jgi:hypothetical protein